MKFEIDICYYLKVILIRIDSFINLKENFLLSTNFKLDLIIFHCIADKFSVFLSYNLL
jgi:hypothetical protein